MAKPKSEMKFLTTSHPLIVFEDNEVGRLKKKIFDAPMSDINALLKEYEVPSPSELGRAGSYIQNTPRARQNEKRRKNDLVLIPVGTTENHGDHANSGLDNFMVSQICEAVRRYSAKKGAPVSIALPPLMYGSHPYHHLGMPGTVIIREEVAKELLIDVMLGLWNDGFRKQIIINNHGHFWMLEAAMQQFCKRFQLPGIYRVLDWHRGVREFFRTTGGGGTHETPFIHADEAETSLGLLLFPEMVNMDYAVETTGKPYLPDGHFDNSVDGMHRPHRWSEGEGHFGIEIKATPEGVVGKPTLGAAHKAKRPLVASLRYLTLVCDQILEALPAGTVPPVEMTSLRTEAELEPYLREPMSEGWRSVYALPKIGF